MNTQFDPHRENKLIERLKQGDTNAFESLLYEYRSVIRRIAMRLSPEISMQEELVQAGQIGLYQAAMRFCPACGVQLLTYAWTWILGEMKRALRSGYPEYAVVSFESWNDPTGRPLAEAIPGEKGIDLQRIDLRTAIMQLSEQEQVLICLRYYRDKSQAETAVLLKKSQAQISKLERKVLDKLSGMLT